MRYWVSIIGIYFNLVSFAYAAPINSVCVKAEYNADSGTCRLSYKDGSAAIVVIASKNDCTCPTNVVQGQDDNVYTYHQCTYRFELARGYCHICARDDKGVAVCLAAIKVTTIQECSKKVEELCDNIELGTMDDIRKGKDDILTPKDTPTLSDILNTPLPPL